MKQAKASIMGDAPWLALILNSWLFFVVAVIFYVVARAGAKKEDDELWERFGREFALYEVKVRRSLPLPRILPLRFRRYLKAAGVLVLLGGFALGTYFAAVRPIILRLGASKAEAVASMPGDGLVRAPRTSCTQAVTIKAPSE